MKVIAVLFLAVASIGLLGCPEEAAKPDPSKAAATTKAAPGAAPATSAKADPGGGW